MKQDPISVVSVSAPRQKLTPALAGLAGALMLSFLANVPASAQGGAELDTSMKKLSYALGMRFGNQLREQLLQQGLGDADPAALAAGLRDVLAGVDSRVTADELRAAVEEVRELKLAERAALGEENQKKGEAFLTRNKDAEGVVTLDSGLQYRILNAAEGTKPMASDTVRVHYIGRLLNGEEFDNSKKRGEPTEFQVDQVVAGWQEALQLMPAGSTWEVWVPSHLAYGENGQPGAIGPNETLHFDIELLEVMPK